MKLKGLILIVAMSALLLLSQSVAVTALKNDVSMRIDDTLADKEFSVDIYFVGTSLLASGEITESVNGTYDVITQSALTSLVVKVNVSGYTTITDDNNITAPHLFLILDGELSVLGAGVLGSAGALIPMSVGTHTLSYLLVGNGNEGFQYASDTIIVRIGADADSFNDFIIETVPLVFDVSDEAVAGEEWTEDNPIYWDWGNWDWYRNFDYTPVNDVEVWVTSEDNTTMLKDGTPFDFGEEGYSVLINGTIDTTGVAGLSADWNFTATTPQAGLDEGWPYGGSYVYPNLITTTGYQFLVDASGLTYIGSNVPTTIDVVKLPDEGAANQPFTYLGVLALADYGYMLDMWWGAHDLDGLTGSSDGTILYEYAFDFVATLSGVYVADAVAAEAPGFQATETAFALVTLGIVAFVIPRFRKEEK